MLRRASKRAVLLLVGMLVAVLIASGVAMATISPTSTATTIANAIAKDTASVSGARFQTSPPSGQPNAVSDTTLAGFPTNGGKYGILTTGDPSLADDSNDIQASVNNGGSSVRGDSDLDVSVLKVDLSVPTGANCLSFDFRFLSEEYPEYVGQTYNDAFIAELDSSTWTTSGSTISAPNNFAFDPNGEEISINSSGVADVTAAEASGTVYDGATQKLQAKTQVTSGSHSLYLSILDQGDNYYDSAVFLDNLALYSSTSAHCQEGAADGDFLVKEGTEVPDGRYPFIVSVGDEYEGETAYDRHICGGTLIDNDSVLTAAHCVNHIVAPYQLSVTAGTTVLSDSGLDSGGQVRDVLDVEIHERYNPSTLAYDVAVLKLKTPVIGIASVRLPSKKQNGFEKPGRLLTTAGWGVTSGQAEYLTQPMRMREAQVPVVSDTKADGIHWNYVPKLMVAAGKTSDGGEGQCAGDSGGPLFAKKTTSTGAVVFYQAGISSFGDVCKTPGDLGVYTEVNNPSIWDFIKIKKSL